MKRNNFTATMLLVLIFLTIYTVKGAVMLDPDLGWHIRTGELILKQGIPKTDPFSYTMSNYPYIDHSWFTSTAIARLLPQIGIYGLSFLFALIGVGSFLIQHITSRDRGRLTLFIGLLTALPFMGIRTQVLSWLFFSILLVLLEEKKGRNRRQYLILPLMFIWVNTHGGFVIGIITLLLNLATGIFLKQKNRLRRLVLLIGSLCMTSCNPYGITIWVEVFKTATDPNLRFTIAEWRPAVYFLHGTFYLYLALLIAVLIKYKNKIRMTPQLIISAFLFINAMLAVRNIPLWLLTAFGLWSMYVPYLEKEIYARRINRQRYYKVKKIIIGCFVVLSLIQTYWFFSSAANSTEEKKYPQKAVVYLKKHPREGNIFSEYDWGGYLLWKYPEKKTFIDGRMAIWKWHQEDKRFLNEAYPVYLEIMSGKKPTTPLITRYGITRIILPTIPKKTAPHPIIQKIRELFQADEKKPAQISYPVEYQDNTATVYKVK